MIFSSYDFVLLFLPISICTYFLIESLAGRAKAAISLVLFSFIFYGWWNYKFVSLLALSIVFNYYIGILLQGRKSRALMTFGIAANLATLFWFKYFNFFVDNLAQFAPFMRTHLEIILPLGISFFTFQQIAWLVDCQRKKVSDSNFLSYTLFVSFFPQLVAGPIVHHAEIMPQLLSERQKGQRHRDLYVGLSIFIVGLAKKVLIADRLSVFSDNYFNSVGAGIEFGAAGAWLGVAAYTLQIYFDFSAYSDMAIGIGRMCGVTLPINFDSPYKARNIQDFWRRWNITLSRFLRDYLYIPMGGNRLGERRRYQNLLITMLLGGLWHGANWTFVLWGAMHGLALAFHSWATKHIPAISRIPAPLAQLITVLFVMLAWVPFRADSITIAFDVYRQMFDFVSPINTAALSHPLIYGQPEALARSIIGRLGVEHAMTGPAVQFLAVAVGFAVAFFLPNTAQIFERDLRFIDRAPAPSRGLHRLLAWRPSIVWAGYVSVAFILCFFFMKKQAPFLYFQF